MSSLLSDTGVPIGAPPTIAAGARSAARRTAFEFARYFVASGGALGVDFGLYRLALSLGLAYPVAALIGFSAGAIVAYVASIAWVFESRSVRRPGVEFGVFVAIGVAGLLLTEALLWLQIERIGLPASWSKIGASGVVFVFNFCVRKAVLFATRAQAQPARP